MVAITETSTKTWLDARDEAGRLVAMIHHAAARHWWVHRIDRSGSGGMVDGGRTLCRSMRAARELIEGWLQ